MTNEKKQQLVNEAGKRGITLVHHPATVAGWKNEYATIAANFPGFWVTTWETVERVLVDDGNFKASDVTLSSWAWRGAAVPVPLELRYGAGIGDNRLGIEP